jgi:DNA-directed RNA polymerase omega subunit
MHIDIANLLDKTGSSYKLVILASRRAIELSEGAAKLVDGPAESKVTNTAIREIAEGKISYKIKESK